MTDDMGKNDRLDATLDTGLAAAADRVDVGDPVAMLGDVRAAAKHRRRRRQAFSGVAAVAALGASALVFATVVDNGGDGLIVSAPPTDPAAGESSADADADAEPIVDENAVEAGDEADTATPPPLTSSVLEVTPSRTEPIVDAGWVIEQSQGVDTRLFPWQGGFLAIRTEFQSQPLPSELPPEIADQFPPEVVGLFPDGLPPTIDEAIEVLEEAGLLGVVTEIISANPDVSEAVYSEGSSTVTTVRFSPDGTEWSDIETDFPIDLDQYPTMASTDDRFVLAAPVGADPAADGPGRGEPTAVDVWSSTDLVTWEQQTIALPGRPVGLPDLLQSQTYLNSVTVNDDAWIVSVATFVNVDELALLDDEQRARVERGELFIGGGGMDDSGVTIEVFEAGSDGPGDDPETIEFTWDELGIDGPREDDSSTTSYTARWGEEPQETDTGVTSGFGFAQLAAVKDGFVAFGSDLRLSSDGVQWSPVGLPDGGFIEWVIETDSGLIVSGRSDDGTAFSYLFEPSSSKFTSIELGDLPDGAGAQYVNSESVVLNDYGDVVNNGGFGSGGSISVAEANGYRFELSVQFADESVTISYTLTDIASGEVVSTETVTDGDLEFEFAKEDYEDPDGLEGFRVFDPESGEELIAVPFEEMTNIELDADGEPIPDSERPMVSEAEPSEPDNWLVAAVGESLVIEQLDGVGNEVYITSTAVQDNAALVAKSDGTMIRFVPER